MHNQNHGDRKLADTSSENNVISNETFVELEEPIISALVELGMDSQVASILICKLKAFSPEYHRRILEYAGIPAEVCSSLLQLFEEKERTKQLENIQNQETLAKISSNGETITNANIQTGAIETAVNHNLQQTEKTLNEKAEKIEETIEKPLEKKTEIEIVKEPCEIMGERETVSISHDVKEDIPITEHVPMPGNASQEINLESKEEIEKWLDNTELRFREMTLEMQEETMPRYIKLRTFFCRDKLETSSSCVGCLIGNTIDCPLFNPNSKKR